MQTFHKALALTSLALLAVSASYAGLIDIYFGTAGNGGIHHAVFDDESGELGEIIQAAELNQAGFVALHPTQPFLYSIAKLEENSAKGHVVAFKMNEDNTLTQLNAQSSEGSNPCHLSLDATGGMLMVANYTSNHSVAAFAVGADGSLATSDSMHSHTGSGEHPQRQKSPHPHSIFPNPANTFAYSPDLGTDRIEIYALDSAHAQLTPTGSAAVPGGAKGPRHLKFSADGRFVYVLLELSMEIAVYKADSNGGMLHHIETVSTFEDRSDIDRITCSELRIHPNGKFVYAANRDLEGRNRDGISVFRCDPETGKLTLIENEPSRVSVPRNFNITPCGTWLIAGGQKSNNLAIFTVNPNTGLLAPHGEMIAFDGSPICIEFSVR
jgi:6-phosphogluconolactonase